MFDTDATDAMIASVANALSMSDPIRSSLSVIAIPHLSHVLAPVTAIYVRPGTKPAEPSGDVATSPAHAPSRPPPESSAMSVRLLLPACCASLVIAGCASIAEPRVRSALVDAGLSERNADCMAGRMVDRLTIAQLRKLESLKDVDRRTLGRLSLADYVGLVERVGDPEVVAVTSTTPWTTA